MSNKKEKWGRLDYEITGRTIKVYARTGEMLGNKQLTRTLFEVRCAGNDLAQTAKDLSGILEGANALAELLESGKVVTA